MSIGSYQNCLLFVSFLPILNSALLAHSIIFAIQCSSHGSRPTRRLTPHVTADSVNLSLYYSMQLQAEHTKYKFRDTRRRTENCCGVLLWRRLQNSEMDLKRLVTKCAEHCTLCVPATGTFRCLAMREM